MFLSGQVGIDADKKLVDGGVPGQLDQAMENARRLLEAEGLTFSDVVKTTLFLTDMADYGVVNERYIAALGDHRPARSAVAVAALPLGALIEVEMIARFS